MFFFSWLTKKPHLAGTPGEKAVVDYIENFWTEIGLNPVKVYPYNVLLSYPNRTNPNRIVLYDGNGRAQYTTQLFEKILRPEQDQPDVVPPFNAYSPPGNPRVYNYNYI